MKRAGDRAAVTAYAWALLDRLDLHHVELRWGHARTQLGSTRCYVDGRVVITLSEVLLRLRGREELLETARHEMAHALVGHGGHGPAWQAAAVAIGAVPAARSPGAVPPPKWLGTCGEGCKLRRHRLDRRVRQGRRCVAHGAEVSWIRLR